ncbi:MAG: hypothetical protein HWQ39_28760 [Nostoc sp. NMS8]|nr:hypothetical protein [Nostoc sp. NMS8]
MLALPLLVHPIAGCIVYLFIFIDHCPFIPVSIYGSVSPQFAAVVIHDLPLGLILLPRSSWK